MTIWIYTDTNKPEGDVERLKVFATSDVADDWFKVNDPEGVAFEYEVMTDQDLVLDALHKAHLVISKYIKPGPRKAQATLDALIQILDRGLAGPTERLGTIGGKLGSMAGNLQATLTVNFKEYR
jgi:hypothetical protein